MMVPSSAAAKALGARHAAGVKQIGKGLQNVKAAGASGGSEGVVEGAMLGRAGLQALDPRGRQPFAKGHDVERGMLSGDMGVEVALAPCLIGERRRKDGGERDQAGQRQTGRE